MRKSYKYLLFILTSLGITMTCYAEEAMNVMSKENTISSTQFEKLKNITFSETQVLINLTDGSVIKHDFSKFDNVIFGEYIPFVGIDEISSENTQFNVYLSDDKLLTVSSSSIIKSLHLVDLSGKTININLSGSESNNIKVSVESLTSVLYVVLAQTEKGVQYGKILIK
ncbi:MAG: hypothetical protein IKJ22_01805 [Paludibacteraceae bacterium]|nr:hypothetical protein [Paludibacteraceae bacterium]